MRIPTLLYHDVVDDDRWGESGFDTGDAAIYKLTRASFAAHLERLATLGAPPALASRVGSSGWMLAFDDGGVSALRTIAPALEGLGWRGHFFMTTGWLGTSGFLSADGLRALAARGHIVGSHSHSHPLAMSSLSRAELRQEWEMSTEILGGILGARPEVASIPGGAYSRIVAETAAEAGIRVLFTSEPTARPWQIGSVTCYGRYTLWRGMSPAAAVELAVGRGTGRIRQRLAWDAKKVVKRVCGPAYRGLRRRLLASRAEVTATGGTALPPPK